MEVRIHCGISGARYRAQSLTPRASCTRCTQFGAGDDGMVGIFHSHDRARVPCALALALDAADTRTPAGGALVKRGGAQSSGADAR